jgi:hypothetical protein
MEHIVAGAAAPTHLLLCRKTRSPALVLLTQTPAAGWPSGLPERPTRVRWWSRSLPSRVSVGNSSRAADAGGKIYLGLNGLLPRETSRW